MGEKEIATALENGYRSIDTASAYGNESDVGRALRSSGIARDEVFVTTKVWNTDQGYGSALAAFDASLARLRLDYVDLYLVHWPGARHRRLQLPARGSAAPPRRQRHRPCGQPDRTAPSSSAGRAAGRPRTSRHRDRGVGPTRPRRPPEAPGHRPHRRPTRQDPGPGRPALAPPARQRRIPKSATPERIRQNLDVFDFELTDADMAAIAALDNGTRTGPDPAFLN